MSMIVNTQELFYIAKQNDLVIDKFIFTVSNLTDVTCSDNDYPVINTKRIENVGITDEDVSNVYISIDTLTNGVLSTSNQDAVYEFLNQELMREILSKDNVRIKALTKHCVTIDTLVKFNKTITNTYKEMRKSNLFIPWSPIRDNTLILGSLRVLGDVKIVTYVCKYKK